MSCGAALFNLRVAAWNAGAAPTVSILPDACDPDLLATVHLDGGGGRSPTSTACILRSSGAVPIATVCRPRAARRPVR